MKFKKHQIIIIVVSLLAVLAAVLYKVGVFSKLKSLNIPISHVEETVEPAPEVPVATFAPIFTPAPTSAPSPTSAPIYKPAPTSAPTPVPAPVVITTPAPDTAVSDEEEENRLTVRLSDSDASTLYQNVSWVFMDNQLISRDKERYEKTKLSDAVSFPLDKTKSNEYMYSQIIEEILRSPIYGDMVARGLRDIKFSTGKTIVDLNPWIDEFIMITDGYYKRPQESHPCGLEYWLTYSYAADGTVDTSTIYVTEQYRNYAIRLCVLLNRLGIRGVESLRSSKNFVLNYTAQNEFRRTELASYQEDWPSLILEYTIKKSGKTANYEYIIGFNLTDRRLEIFSNGYSDGSSGGRGDPSKPTPTPVPTPVPTEQPGKKDPAYDPYNQGNAPVGGGPNQPTDGAGTFQPTPPPRNTAGPIINNPTSAPAPVQTAAPATNQVTVTTDSEGGQHTEFNLDPPPAAPIAIEQETFMNPDNGQNVVITGDTVFSGEITLPD